MNNMIDSISSLEWWVSVVIVGLAINLLASYLKPHIDHVLSRYSSRQRSNNEKRKAAEERHMAMLREDKHEQIIDLFAALRSQQRALGYFFIGLFSPTLGALMSGSHIFKIATFFLGFLSMSFGWRELNRAGNIVSVVYKAAYEKQ